MEPEASKVLGERLRGLALGRRARWTPRSERVDGHRRPPGSGARARSALRASSLRIIGAMIPAGDIMRELILALGAAMLAGSAAVVVRERSRKPGDTRARPNMRFVILNMLLGAVMAAWGLASIIAAR